MPIDNTADAPNVADYLLEGKVPEQPALLLLEREHTYGDLQYASYDVARYLVREGGLKGDRVILAADNSFFWVVAYLGILRAGMVCIPIPPSLPPREIDHILQVTEPRFAFLQGDFAERNRIRFAQTSLVLDQQKSGASALHSVCLANLHSAPMDTALPITRPDDLAALMFTSGSSSRPRGVMISHANIMANTESIIQYLGLTQADRIMTVLPFHYCFGTSLLHTHLRAGASLVIDSRFLYPVKVLQRMQETRCTGLAGVPTHYQILLRNSMLSKMSFPHLRYAQQAGGHLAPSLIRELCHALPGTKIVVMYGQTEATARLSYLPPELLDRKLGSIGKGIPGVRLSVLDESGKPVECGAVGEIVAEGKNIARGYWRDAPASAHTFREGKLYTGDLATVDEDGYIFIVDRATDFLKVGGKRVSCRQIEEQLLECNLLLDAVVLGVHDDVLGEAVMAFVVPRIGGSSDLVERLRLSCQQHMSPQLVPREIVVLDSFPINSSGKVSKQALRDMLGYCGAVRRTDSHKQRTNCDAEPVAASQGRSPEVPA